MENQTQASSQPEASEPIILPTQQPPIKPKKAFKKWILITLVIILILSLPLGGYLLLDKMGIKPKPSTVTITTPTPTPDPTTNPDLIGANWKTYNGKSFSFKYPADWEINKEISKDGIYLEIGNTNLNLEIRNGIWLDSSPYTCFEKEDESILKIDEKDIKYWIDKPIINGEECTTDTQELNKKLLTVDLSNVNDYKTRYVIYAYYNNSDENLNTIKNVLSTFNFTNETTPAPTAEPNTEYLKPDSRCKLGGCSSEICQSANSKLAMSTCIYKEEYACYVEARCEMQASGQCGWTMDENLKSCLQAAK